MVTVMAMPFLGGGNCGLPGGNRSICLGMSRGVSGSNNNSSERHSEREHEHKRVA